jgi:hypothetical protein
MIGNKSDNFVREFISSLDFYKISGSRTSAVFGSRGKNNQPAVMHGIFSKFSNSW